MSNQCPHSPKRTCNGGFNSCLQCPKLPKENKTVAALLGIVMAIVFLILLATSCAPTQGIERYTYVRPTWVHANGLKQCVPYQSRKPVKRAYYFRIQKFTHEIPAK